MLLLPAVFVCTAISIYIAALRAGMRARRWAIAALAFGPFLLPIFTSHKRLTIVRARGRDAWLFKP
ncbi:MULTISPECIES: hypothetical protein [Alkalimonas]|uniref:Uncharacterized protein n=1 Tax=Alkalimonas mucilaginosa TaxID=3057676 RepID=A0ABU7JD16_9GAMM|nr:hypothetical protein [Alkalimonas sp. MEB004]MEE2022943.1 hypothetical protein [Alkalimonas sp. MEB004]